MRRNTVTEKAFLKSFALNQFNNQFGTAFKQENFDICSITPKGNFTHGYEIMALEGLETFKLIMHLNIARSDTLTPFVLQLRPPFQVKGLGDEVFTATGSIDSAHHLYGGYPFLPLSYDVSMFPVLLDVTNEPLLLADGGMILIN